MRPRLRQVWAAIALAAVVAGCKASHPAAEVGGPPAPVTFNKDIAPIVFARCSPCHRHGQPVPFALLEYRDVLARARRIAEVTARRQMPPWLPEPGYGEFAGERWLRDDEIQIIQRWVEQGALEGDPSHLPKLPEWTEGWTLGEPDLVAQMARPFILPSNGEDVFRNFVLPVGLPAGRFVRAVEFRPGNAHVVHHAVISVDRTRASRRRDGSDGIPGYGGMPAQSAQNPEGHFLGWTPGREPIVMPPGMPWYLERGSDLVVQLHLPTTGKPEQVQVSVGLFFSDVLPTRVPLMIRLGSKVIDIPAGEKAYAINDTYELPVDVDVLSVYPHAHYLAKETEGVAVLPDGQTRWLIRIKQWDFHWQQDYRLAVPLHLPRGTTLRMRYTYDNSAGNSRNHRHPPRAVLYGPNSTDEMGDLWLQVLPGSATDREMLSKAFLDREARANVDSGEMLVRRAPDDADHREFLGSSYLQVGRVEEASEQLERALRLNPRHAGAHNMLGGALLMRGGAAEAVSHLRVAVSLEPGDDRLRFNLGNALNMAGRIAAAEHEFREAIALNPDFGEAHNNLGALLLSTNRLREAVVSLERALAIDSGYADAHINLGAAFGAMGRRNEATRHVRRALEIRPDSAHAQDILRLLGDPQAK